MKKDDLDASKGILLGLILSIVLWSLVAWGFYSLVAWLQSFLG